MKRRLILERFYIRDDMGELWFLEGGRIRLVSGEREEYGEYNGYPVSSWEDAIKLLNNYGYITGDDIGDK